MKTARLLLDALSEATAGLAGPGDWFSGAARLDAWAQVRLAASDPLDQRRRQALSPLAVEGEHPATELLSAAAVEVVHRVASDPGRLTRRWADSLLAELGEEIYTELVGVTATAMVIDTFDLVMGEGLRPLPAPLNGAPAQVRPDDVGDVGAWVSQALQKKLANVSRALSLVPETMALWRALVDRLYSRGQEFLDLEWDRHLSRPQVELVAARITALNECVY